MGVGRVAGLDPTHCNQREGKERKKETEVAQSCPTLCNPMDCSPPGFSVHGIFQATVLEWGAIALSDRVYLFHAAASKINKFLVPTQVLNPYSLHLKSRSLTTEPPGKSQPQIRFFKV